MWVSVKVLNKKKIIRFFGAGLLGLSALLLGCVGAETQDVASATDEVISAQAEPPANNLEFSTKDKPTKTIETPWGPREIYDPVQDKEVRAAFEQFVYSKKHTKSVLKDPIIGASYDNYMNSLSKMSCKVLINPFCEMCVLKNVKRRDEELNIFEEKMPICSRVDYGSESEEKYCSNLNLLNAEKSIANLADFFQINCIKWE